jgi:hypothetical protein
MRLDPISERLCALHEALPTHPGARPLIDAHLLASAMDQQSPCVDHVLDPANTYHYHNLPNLIPCLRRFLVDSAWESDLLGMLMSPFCLHINRTLRPHHLAPSTSLSQTAAINLLHGLLLGLYPYNVRQPGYVGRVRIAAWLRSALCSGGKERERFIGTHEALLGLAVIEYLSNVVCDFCPVEEALLIKSPSCRFLINHLCDAFRAELAAEDGDNTEWHKGLEARAAGVLASVLRQLKLCNRRPCRRTVARAVTRKVPPALIETVLSMPIITLGTENNSVSQIKLLRPELTFAEIQLVEFVWASLSLRPLPASLYRLQREALDRRGSCELVQGALTSIHLCITCALGHKGCILQHECSYRCDTKALHCKSCSGRMQPIRLIGRVLRVRQTNYCLCPTCLRPTRWESTPIPLTCRRCTQPAPPTPQRCSVCEGRNIALVREVIDCDRLEFAGVPLCHRHARCCLSARSSAVYDLRGFQADMLLACSAASSAKSPLK